MRNAKLTNPIISRYVLLNWLEQHILLNKNCWIKTLYKFRWFVSFTSLYYSFSELKLLIRIVTYQVLRIDIQLTFLITKCHKKKMTSKTLVLWFTAKFCERALVCKPPKFYPSEAYELRLSSLFTGVCSGCSVTDWNGYTIIANWYAVFINRKKN